MTLEHINWNLASLIIQNAIPMIKTHINMIDNELYRVRIGSYNGFGPKKKGFKSCYLKARSFKNPEAYSSCYIFHTLIYTSKMPNT